MSECQQQKQVIAKYKAHGKFIALLEEAIKIGDSLTWFEDLRLALERAKQCREVFLNRLSYEHSVVCLDFGHRYDDEGNEIEVQD